MSGVDCPLCGRELGVEPRSSRARWNKRQDWLLLRLETIGASNKLIALVLQTSSTAIESRLVQLRRNGQH